MKTLYTSAYVVAMDDAGTEIPDGWLLVDEELVACIEAARALGCEVPSPFQSLAFLALSVIPSLKITDRGLVDVDRFELVPLKA